MTLCPNGCDVYPVTVSNLNITLDAGTYWLNLTDGITQNGGFMGWDENSGPSLASDSLVGTIPSEDPDIYGYTNGGGTPEPGSIILFGSGILGLAGAVRRKMKL